MGNCARLVQKIAVTIDMDGQVERVLLSMDLCEGDMSAQLPGVQFDRLFQIGNGQVEPRFYSAVGVLRRADRAGRQ